jgi:hypothetical protein
MILTLAPALLAASLAGSAPIVEAREAPADVGIARTGTTHTGTAHAGTAQVGTAQAGTVQAGRDTLPRRDTTAAGRPRPAAIPVTPELLASAFRNPGARELLAGARVARLRHDSALIAYDTDAFQRMSVGVGVAAIGRERLFFRTESASRIRWHRDRGAFVEITGARSVFPMVDLPDARKDIERDVRRETRSGPSIPYYPGSEAIWIGPAREEVQEGEFIHPLARGAEAYYRYSRGDSVIYRLPGNQTIRLVELQIEPRRPEWNLVIGTFWFDVSTHQLVRAAYRPAVPINVTDHLEEGELDDVPLAVRPLMFPMTGQIEAITVEYGLYEQRFWLPRLQTASGSGRASFARASFTIEQRYDYRSVNVAEDLPEIALTPAQIRSDSLWRLDSLARRGDSTARSVAAAMRAESAERAAARRDTLRMLDSLGRAGDESARARARAIRAVASATPQCDTASVHRSVNRRGGNNVRSGDNSVRVVTEVPCDVSSLIDSPALPPSIFTPGEELFSSQDRDALLSMLDMSMQADFAPQRPVFEWGLHDGLLRYNRVEGLSPAIAARMTLGRGYTATASARIGTADLQPNAELALSRSDGRRVIGGAVFRRLAPANDWGSPLSFGPSVSSLLFGRDEGFYYRTWGAEATATTAGNPYIQWRAFAERHEDAAVRASFSLGGRLDGIPNIDASNGNIAGLSVRLVHTLGHNPRGFRLYSDARIEEGLGDFNYMRGFGDFTLSRPIGPVASAITVSGGAAHGSVPVQRLFRLGGSQTVRGQIAGTAVGEAFWMARGELGAGFPGVRPVVFGDIGWAGAREDWSRPGRPISGAGIGASFLDGLVRFDLARGIYPRAGLRADMYLEARF